MITVYSVVKDEVIRSAVATGFTDYEYALAKLFPLIDKFDEQRKVQRKKFYERLKDDILRGCIMPPITLAFVHKELSNELDKNEIQSFIENNISEGYILDGMQRLNTLQDASSDPNFNSSGLLSVNVIIAERYDLLLYRMITLNNGQKPMTARHQIEMLTKGVLDVDNLDIVVVSEKDTEVSKPQGAFKKGDIAAAYTAFLTNSVNNENSRIIESKLDEILVGKVMDSDLTNLDVSFSDILELVATFSKDNASRDWLRLGNNLIGFSVGAKRGFSFLKLISKDHFRALTETFDEAFSALNVSKINVGKFRRELSMHFFSNLDRYQDADSDELTQVFFEKTMVD
ncbi:hypothetical protein [Sphingobium yanoikuyae]|uniref:DUF262 domain-containing protein n=1 Tax=Sphingobium yanoikuyae TaxID=13690 RepID=A0A291N6D6_SPHYA|nr:hypothetical protein [Sphingobium yanoikuyae]ATI82906.1 hypothetical protein A6768_24840 [Sphingobium yanoikuyae]